MASDKQRFQRGRCFLKGMLARILSFIISMEEYFIDHITEAELEHICKIQEHAQAMFGEFDAVTTKLREDKRYEIG